MVGHIDVVKHNPAEIRVSQRLMHNPKRQSLMSEGFLANPVQLSQKILELEILTYLGVQKDHIDEQPYHVFQFEKIALGNRHYHGDVPCSRILIKPQFEDCQQNDEGRPSLLSTQDSDSFRDFFPDHKCKMFLPQARGQPWQTIPMQMGQVLHSP